MSPKKPPYTIPRCMRCGRRRVLYVGSICRPCADEEAKKKRGRT